MAEDLTLTVHADGRQVQRELARARRAMDAALLRHEITERTSLTALITHAPGVTHNPACTPAPPRVAWSKTAHDAIHPKRESPQ